MRNQAHACTYGFLAECRVRRVAAAGGLPLGQGTPRSLPAGDGAGPRTVSAAGRAGQLAVAEPHAIRGGGVANDAAGASGSRAVAFAREARRRAARAFSFPGPRALL